MARGQILNIPNQTAQLVTTLSREQKASLSMLNPNDGVCYVKINGPAAPNVAGWDWKVPSQSYCQLPGPWESLGVYYLDQSGSGRTAEVNLYELDSNISVPSFIAIGRAVQSAGTTMDISMGSQPQNPPASTVRLWADSSGNLHVLGPSGVDKQLVDSTTALGGDLYGTITAAHISVQSGQNIVMANGTYVQWSDTSITRWNPAQIGIRGTGGLTVQGPVNIEGSSGLQVGGNIVGNSDINISSGNASVAGTITANGAIWANNVIYVGGGDVYLQRWGVGLIRVVGGGGVQVNGSVIIETDYQLSFAVNGYYLKGISGYPVIYTQGSLGCGGGSLYLSSSIADPARIYWDGTNIHVPPGGGFVSESHIYNRSGDGNYYSATNDASVFGVWNPGEWRVKSPAAGNLRTIGSVISEGGGCQGAGAYINTASSITLKKNIVELNPTESLGIILDRRLRPVTFEYIEPSERIKYSADRLAESPDPLAPDIIWPDTKIGFLSEEVQTVVPPAAGGVEGTSLAYGISIDMLVPILWSAVRELDARIKRLEPATITP